MSAPRKNIFPDAAHKNFAGSTSFRTSAPAACDPRFVLNNPGDRGCPMWSPIPRFLSATGIILKGGFKPTDNQGPHLVIQNISKYNRDIDIDIDIDKYIHTYIALHCIALHCITLHYITLHYITLHYITLHTYIYIYTYIYMYVYIYIYMVELRSCHVPLTLTLSNSLRCDKVWSCSGTHSENSDVMPNKWPFIMVNLRCLPKIQFLAG